MRWLTVLVWIAAGFGAGVTLAVGAITLLSSNAHDRNVEAVMTAAFVAGPIGAVLGALAGILRTRRPPPHDRTS